MPETEEASKLKRSRAVYKGFLSKSSSRITDLLAATDCPVTIYDAIDEFEQQLRKYEAADEQFLACHEGEEFDNELQLSTEFRLQIRAPLVEAKKVLQRLQEPRQPSEAGSVSSSAAASHAGSSASSHQVSVKLPKLELPHFDGKYTEWQSFWEHFETHIHNNDDVPVISKFSYLVSLLDGEAKQAINGYSHTESNYNNAVTVLKERFGDEERIVYAHVSALLDIEKVPNVKGPKYLEQLRNLQTEITSHVRSLEALKVTGEQCATFLVPIILKQLPQDLRHLWAREGSSDKKKKKERDLDFLLKFLSDEIDSLERSENYEEKNSKIKKDKPKSCSEPKSSAAGLLAANSKSSEPCVFCNRRNHKSELCYEVSKLNEERRVQRIDSENLCFKCLQRGHISKFCPNYLSLICGKCKNKYHNALMCGVKWGQILQNMKSRSLSSSRPSVTPETPPTINAHAPVFVSTAGASTGCVQGRTQGEVQTSCVSTSSCTFLQTASIPAIACGNTQVIGKVLFDSGAERSYIRSNFLHKLNSTWKARELLPCSIFGGSTSSEWRNIYTVQLACKDGSVVDVEVAEIPVICAPMYRSSVAPEILSFFSQLDLADDYSTNAVLEIDVVIGLKNYWHFLTVTDAVQYGGLVALKSLFGYILSGCCEGQSTLLIQSSSSQLLSPAPHIQLLTPNAAVDKLWSIESIGVTEKETTATLEDEQAREHFAETVLRDHDTGRYEVSLPWRSDEHKEKLGNNEKLVKKCFDRMMNNLNRKPQLKQDYHEVFEKYEKQGIIEEVPLDEVSTSNPVFYMPHRPVIKESSTSTPVRPVFNASFGGYDNYSLNDAILSGPSLIPDLPEILLRFRTHKIALSSDISKAFLQINVNKFDRDVHRFFLDSDEGLRHMRFVRLPFGNTASPWLLNATIKYHLNLYQSNDVIKSLQNDMFVDNWLSGAETIDEAYERYCSAKSILADAQFPLSQWYTIHTCKAYSMNPTMWLKKLSVYWV